MKVCEQIAALLKFDADDEVLPCFPAGMEVIDCEDWGGTDKTAYRHCNGFWPSEPREGDIVRESGKRFGTNRTWKRDRGQWVLQTEAGEK